MQGQFQVLLADHIHHLSILAGNNGRGVGARFIATLSGGQVIGVERPAHHPQEWNPSLFSHQTIFITFPTT